MRVLLVASAVLALCVTAPARAEWLLAASVTRVAAGTPVKVTVVRDAGDASPLPERLPAVVEAGAARVGVTLVAVDAPDAADGAAFRRDYVLEWPAGLSGPVVLSLDGRVSSRLLLAAEAAPPLPAEDEMAAAPEPAPSMEAVRAPPALTVNEPMYFLLGVDYDITAHVQLSFKYRLFDAEGPVVEWLPFLRGLHFGYTQTSLWDLAADSKPFRDTSYRPSLFYQWDFASAPDSPHRVGLRAGYEHESNGRDSENSRSIDTLFTSVDWRYRLPGGDAYVGFTPKVWGYLDRSENPDIYRYRGYGELGLRFGRDDGWLARLKLRRAMGGVGSTQLDLSYPLRRAILSETAAYLHLQIFDGYGPTLLDYNQSQGTQFRIGFSIQR